MEYADPPGNQQRLARFREKIKTLSFEELFTLAAVLKQQSADLSEEFSVLAETVFARRREQLARRRENGTR